MWSFVDDQERTWDVTLGRESWGAFFAIFVPRRGADIRQTMLAAEAVEDAHRELDTLGEEQFRQLLSRSEPKT